jgi:hypothetical protein
MLRTMSRLILLVPLLAACSEPAPPPARSGANAPPGQHLLVQVTGFAANEGKSRRCSDEVSRAGYVQDPAAPVRAVLILEGPTNRLQIISQARGIVRNENLPGWDMARLCRTAIDGILPVLAQEPPPGYAPAPPPSRPVPPGARPAGPYTPPALLPAPADAPKNVVELTRRGEQQFARGDYANALVAYAEANRLDSTPPLLFDTALCYRMLNRPQEALRYVQLYLDRAPQASNRADAEGLASDLRRQLGEEE